MPKNVKIILKKVIKIEKKRYQSKISDLDNKKNAVKILTFLRRKNNHAKKCKNNFKKGNKN